MTSTANTVAIVRITGNRISPYLIDVLRLDTVNTEYRQIIDQFDADMLQRQIHPALYQVFKAGAQDGPVVFVFEDIHWIDPASRDFLTYLIRNVDNLPIFLVFVLRRSAGETEIAIPNPGCPATSQSLHGNSTPVPVLR